MRPWLAVSIGILAAGCVHTSVQRLDQSVRPATAPDSVTVLLERPQRPHTVIATIAAMGESAFDSYGDLRRALLADAAALGGDAVVLGQETTKTDFILTGTAMIESDRKRLTGDVIVFNFQ